MTWESKTWSEMSADDVFAIMKLRTDVFFLEQKITEEELDALDRLSTTRHLWAAAPSGEAIAYARVVWQDPAPVDDHGMGLSIGRLVVDPEWRGRGLAHQLMQRALEFCDGQDVILHAQQWVSGLYSSHGFVSVGEPFDEAGIVHVRMVRRKSGA